MAHQTLKWDIGELSKAMANAIFQRANGRFLKQHGDAVKFNGFWRDGDKQNVCAWLNKATWYDAKTGEGGSCKDFARVAFNMTLPEFMAHYGTRLSPVEPPQHKTTTANALAVGDVNRTWHLLCERDASRQDHAATWLEHERGFINPRSSIGSGFANLYREDLELFAHEQHHFIKKRLTLGHNLIVPLRSSHSAKVENLFFRALDTAVSKEQKSRLLNGQGGWSNTEKSPRAFGFPHLIHDFPKLVLCEGMADHFATECLLECDDNYLSIGAANASALHNWALWLCTTKYKGSVTILYQLDRDSSGKISTLGIGQSKAVQALKMLLQNKISASLFRWPNFLKRIDASFNHQLNDVADVCKIHGTKAISDQFMTTLNEVENGIR